MAQAMFQDTITMKVDMHLMVVMMIITSDYYHHHPAYKYEYGVHDQHTKDHKSQWEHRDGDVVKGEYTLDEADGTKRIVKYSSDKHNGFQAHVERIGHAHHDAPAHHHGHHY
ncbi:hypothetical protein PVAND_015430 [Polypedilum vanderplanki]|uniref:Cuticle protein n=1 Tax=Polypedilum vanderplanki TaxID=319348 RepID=A0A9J6BCL2_POLVA|nr:hypothetical protein PVAND_015430 [Polypedilum vanderplanki]